MVLNPKDSAKFISDNNDRIKILKSGIEKLGNVLIEEITTGKLKPDNFSQTDVHPKPEDKHALSWIFVVDTLNFCFWSYENEVGWTVDGYTGYFALCAAINRAIKNKIDILNPKFCANITDKQLKEVLKSDNSVEIPLFDERIKCLREIGNVLLEKFDGSFENVVKKSENSAVVLLKLVVDNFPCFKDEAFYKDTEISLYKRAQILIGDIWACFKNEGLGHFKDINEITAFADYRVPQTLQWFGVLEYENKLLDKLKGNIILNNGDEEEVEIRGCTIHAVELIKDFIGSDRINSILIDHFLWDFRRKHAKEILDKGIPFHKTYSIYY